MTFIVRILFSFENSAFDCKAVFYEKYCKIFGYLHSYESNIPAKFYGKFGEIFAIKWIHSVRLLWAEAFCTPGPPNKILSM